MSYCCVKNGFAIKGIGECSRFAETNSLWTGMWNQIKGEKSEQTVAFTRGDKYKFYNMQIVNSQVK